MLGPGLVNSYLLCYYLSVFRTTARALCVDYSPAPSSSGLGYLVLIQKIAGSNPAGVTNVIASL